MTSKVPARSILKTEAPKPKPTISEEQKAKAERDRRNLGIALHHANRIQNQKEIKAQILSSIETLVDFPTGCTFTSAEASKFASLVQPFQPSDFDSLVEERRVDCRCGYALCSDTPRSVTLGSSAAWKLKGKGAGDYCSNDCLRKALYVKAQLSEVPAWEREPGQQPDVVLHQDDRPSAILSRWTASARVPGQVANEHDLAVERGETAASFRPGQVMASTIVEKTNISGNASNIVNHNLSSHTAIEGYEPRKRTKHSPESTLPADDDGDGYVGSITTQDVGDEENDAWRELFKNVER